MKSKNEIETPTIRIQKYIKNIEKQKTPQNLNILHLFFTVDNVDNHESFAHPFTLIIFVFTPF